MTARTTRVRSIPDTARKFSELCAIVRVPLSGDKFVLCRFLSLMVSTLVNKVTEGPLPYIYIAPQMTMQEPKGGSGRQGSILGNEERCRSDRTSLTERGYMVSIHN